ncbi:PqqD family protein [Bacillus cereus]|uniref:PqqD family protein n=1 Tax=Bacillus cereus TaxID=1396 RepID=UPI0018F50046|nr:PqqD family protein [Bacillus cereus]MBJ8055372.1 PqqD family protein [Bacillus cereus]
MTKYIRNPFVNSRVINNKFYISNHKQGYELNEVSKEIWVLLKNPTSINDITHYIIEEFDGDKDEISKDIEDFIIQLHSKELVDKV